MIKTLSQLADCLGISIELLSASVTCVGPGKFETNDPVFAEVMREVFTAQTEHLASERRLRKSTRKYECALRKGRDRRRVKRDRTAARVQRCTSVRVRQTGARRSHRTVKRSASSSPPSRSSDPEPSRRASNGGAL